MVLAEALAPSYGGNNLPSFFFAHATPNPEVFLRFECVRSALLKYRAARANAFRILFARQAGKASFTIGVEEDSAIHPAA